MVPIVIPAFPTISVPPTVFIPQKCGINPDLVVMLHPCKLLDGSRDYPDEALQHLH
jgi:hypothetical protein